MDGRDGWLRWRLQNGDGDRRERAGSCRWPIEWPEPLAAPGIDGGHGRDKVAYRGEEPPVLGLDGNTEEDGSKRRLSPAGLNEEHHRPAFGDEAAGGEVLDKLSLH